MAGKNWHIVETGPRNTRVMLDPNDPKAPYFNVHYWDIAGDNSSIEFVHNNGGTELERVEIDRITIGGVGPVGDHEKAIRKEIEKRGLPTLDVALSMLFGVAPEIDTENNQNGNLRDPGGINFRKWTIIAFVVGFTLLIYFALRGIFNF
jgi:hypothetical protein